MRFVEMVDVRRGRDTVHVNPLHVRWVEEDFATGGTIVSLGERNIVTTMSVAEVLELLEDAATPGVAARRRSRAA